MSRYPPWGMLGPRAIAMWGLRTKAGDVRIEGLEHIPATGPVLLVARHYHHLLDAAVLIMNVTRPIHIVVGLDWAENTTQRTWIERACRAAQWPIVLRPQTLGERAGFTPDELLRYTRNAMRDATSLLRAGRVVLVFPEGYPTIDPAGQRKPDDDAFLPFAPGYARMLAWAQRDGTTRVAVIPVGFRYTRGVVWSIVARIGPALADPSPDNVERAVRELSQPSVANGPHHRSETGRFQS